MGRNRGRRPAPKSPWPGATSRMTNASGDDGMTRSVVLYELMSLDGFADDPGEGEWFGDAGEELIDFLGEVISTQDSVLLGRRTFEKWAPYWPGSTMQPFADFINTT